MIDEHVTGTGEVFVKDTGESIGRFRYSWVKWLMMAHRPDSLIAHIVLEVDLNESVARGFLVNKTVLVLRLSDGRLQDFKVRGSRDTRMEAMGDARSELR